MSPDTSDAGQIVAPKGYRQRDFLAGWRACERDVMDRGQQIVDLEAAAERATMLAERYGDAIVAISAALNAERLNDKGKILKARLAIVALGGPFDVES